jgi:hypothetical protein
MGAVPGFEKSVQVAVRLTTRQHIRPAVQQGWVSSSVVGVGDALKGARLPHVFVTVPLNATIRPSASGFVGAHPGMLAEPIIDGLGATWTSPS